jgi:Lrp/AsnC family leucine-responsive transcriptional regulator
MSDSPAAKVPRSPPVPAAASGLDRIDLAILRALQDNGRLTYQALSEKVGLSPRPCLERVRRLERRGVIQGFTVLLDAEALGHPITALAEISLRDTGAATRQRLERALGAHPAVVELNVVNGEYDYSARIVASSLADYEALTDAFLTDAGFGIARIHSTFVLKTLKRFKGHPVPDSTI